MPTFLLLSLACVTLRLPGEAFTGTPPPLTEAQAALQVQLQSDVKVLSMDIGDRQLLTRERQLAEAATWIEGRLASMGYPVERQCYPVGASQACNLAVEVRGTTAPSEIVVVGAHYDTNPGTPGADDNASGVAAVLYLAQVFRQATPARTVRFVAFANEEEPHFWTETMGSLVYARACKAREDDVVAMLSLESMAFYSTKPRSQGFPFPLSFFYPKTGDYVALVANVDSRELLEQVGTTFRAHATLPAYGGAVPERVTGVGWSDHWSFWQVGYPALMVTDTAVFRNRNYHHPTDTPDSLDWDRFTRAVVAVEEVVRDLARQGAT